jgi:hypothetical protein
MHEGNFRQKAKLVIDFLISMEGNNSKRVSGKKLVIEWEWPLYA